MIAKYIPGGVWTPAARVAALERLTGERNTAAILASILVEAVLSAISGIVVFVISLAWVRDVNAPLAPLIVFAFVSAAILHLLVCVTGRAAGVSVVVLTRLAISLVEVALFTARVLAWRFRPSRPASRT